MKLCWSWACCLFVGSVTAVHALSAEEINVADHGIVPGGDVTHSLNRLLDSVRGRSGVTLVFPKGRYDFYPDNAVEQFRAVTNHDNSLKRMAFQLALIDDVTIDGGDSLFMFHGRISPFVLDRVNGATLENFTIDWSRPFHDELTVSARDEQDMSFVVEVDPKRYPYRLQFGKIWFERYDWEDPFGSNIIFDPKTRAPVFDTKKYSVNFGRPMTVTQVGRNRLQFAASVKSPPPVGTKLIVYGVHPTSRLCPAIHVANSRDIRVEDVTVHAAGGMALIAERVENIHLDHFVVTSNEDRMVSTRADATHFVGCKGRVELQNCVLEHMLDDGINVHGAYVKVEEQVGAKEFICAISHRQQWGLTFAAAGDMVALLSRETLLPKFETTVESVDVLNEQRFRIALADIPDPLPDGPLSLENLSWYPDVVMKGNVIRENRARSALITTKGRVLIEENYFSSQMHGILIEGDNNKWYESGGVKDVTITNNVFENIGFGGGPVYPLLASPLFTPEQRMGDGQYHRNINFVNNRVKSFNGHLVSARSVSGLNISGNRLEFSSDYPSVSTSPAIDLEYCDDVSIADNEATGFDRKLSIRVSGDTRKVTTNDNEGLE